ncbi:MAG: matrixin family metalloprotease [bacterium]|nr:matrixin family metalloprotease [bacterium]
MDVRGTRLRIWARLCAGCVLGSATLILIGCGVASSGDPAAGGGNYNGGLLPGGSTPYDDGDPVASTVLDEDPFADYRTVALADDVTESLDGSITSASKVDAYDIGPIFAGDRLVISVDATGSLDPVVAIFDANGDALIVNDDRNYYGGDLDASIDLRSRRTTDQGYVAVAASPGSHTTGGYTLRVRRSPGEPIPPVSPQVVYLNFDGADGVVIGRRAPVDIPVFEGSLLGAEFVGQTELLIEETVAKIREDYMGLDVEFISSREDPSPAGPLTTIHFGAYDPGLLGIADYVDEYNHALVQKAIIYVDTFQAFLPLNPSVEEMANALSNVASHETGHLLGLNHTRDARGIMDITANLNQMLASQSFNRSVLHEAVFPAGHQNAGRLLVESVGGDLGVLKASAAAQLRYRSSWYDEGDPIPARFARPFSSCSCAKCAKHDHRPLEE